MIWMIYSIVFIATFFFMEFMAWFSHKYLMHGLMWYFHADHHVPNHKILQKNDLFFLIFAIPSWLCIMLGMIYSFPMAVCIGFGIAFYGLCYFLVHEIFIHQRLNWFKNSDSIYLRAIRKAHKVHHKKMVKEDGECFGMLIVPRKYFIEARQHKNQGRNNIA